MRALIQRVSHATVEVNESVVGKIDQGLLVLVGFEKEESTEELEWMVNKLIHLRVFEDEDEKMNFSVQDIKGELMIVSQFTLHAQTKKGHRPSYNKAAPPNEAEEWYKKFINMCQQKMETNVKTGVFGAHMQIHLNNDGPVTIMIDTKNKE